jgi:hypothetical protein
MVAGPIFVLVIILIVIFFLVTASSRFLLLLFGLAAAASSATRTLLARPSSTVLDLLLVALLILSFLLFGKLLNLPALLEIMALSAVDLAIWPVGLAGFLSCRGFLAISACSIFLAGALCLGFLGSVAGALDGHHCLAFALPIALPALFLQGGGVVVFRIDFNTSIFPKESPPFFCTCTLVRQFI